MWCYVTNLGVGGDNLTDSLCVLHHLDLEPLPGFARFVDGDLFQPELDQVETEVSAERE